MCVLRATLGAGKVRHGKEHIWSQWIRDHAGELPAERWSATLGLIMDSNGGSFSELPYVSTRDKASVLHVVTREVCRDCNGQLGRNLEPKAKPVFLAMATEVEWPGSVCLITYGAPA